jgi:hypothetical protein
MTHSTISEKDRSELPPQLSRPFNFPHGALNVPNSEGAPASNARTTESALPTLQSQQSFTAPERPHPPNPSPPRSLPPHRSAVLSPTVPRAGAPSALPVLSRQQTPARSASSRHPARLVESPGQDPPKPPAPPGHSPAPIRRKLHPGIPGLIPFRCRTLPVYEDDSQPAESGAQWGGN